MNGWVGWLLAASIAVVYLWLMTLRNRRIVRPAMTDHTGRPLPESDFRFSDGETTTYVDSGQGTAVVFVPGADGVKETFRYQLPALAVRYRAVSASLRERFERGATMDRFADDLGELMDGLDIGPAVLVGQSLGGAIAMQFAARHPERVRGLVVANSLTRIRYDHVGFNRTRLAPVAMFTTRYLPTALGRWLARLWSRLEVWIFDASPGADRIVEYALWTGPRTVSPAVSEARVDRLRGTDLRPELPSISAPTLVIKGPRDHYTPPSWAEEIARLIPGAVYETLDGTGHCSHISMPGSFNRLLMDWLGGLEGHGTQGQSEEPEAAKTAATTAEERA